jgi:hypothetical protein
MHVAFERFWPMFFRVEAAFLSIVMASVVQVPCAALGLCVIVLLVVLVTHLGFRLHAWMTQPVMG